MANLTITNDRMISVRNAAQIYINKHPERTKFHVGLEKFLKNTKALLEAFGDEENDIYVDCALIEDKKFVYETTTRGEKVLATDPAKAKEKQKLMRKLNNKSIQVPEYFVKEADIPVDLEAGWYQLFLGVIIEKDPLEENGMTAEMVVDSFNNGQTLIPN